MKTPRKKKYLWERIPEFSFFKFPPLVLVLVDCCWDDGGGGGGGMDDGESLLSTLLGILLMGCLAWPEDDDSSGKALISDLETLALFFCPHCNSTSPLPTRLGLGLGLVPCLCVWLWLLSECGGLVVLLLWWSWFLDGDLNLKALVSKLVLVELNPFGIDLPFSTPLGFLPLLKGTQSGLTLWYLYTLQQSFIINR